MALVIGELLEDGITAAIPEPAVFGVDAEVRPDERVFAHETPEAGLDEVVQTVVERAGVARRRRAAQDDVMQASGHESLLGVSLVLRPVHIRRAAPRWPGEMGPARVVSVADRARSRHLAPWTVRWPKRCSRRRADAGRDGRAVGVVLRPADVVERRLDDRRDPIDVACGDAAV